MHRTAGGDSQPLGHEADVAALRFVGSDSLGGGVAEGEKSLAIEVTLQPQDKSFTEEELGAISAKIVTAAEKLGAKLRS